MCRLTPNHSSYLQEERTGRGTVLVHKDMGLRQLAQSPKPNWHMGSPPLVHCQLPKQNQSSSCLPLLCTLNRCACWSSPGNNVLIFAVHDFLLRGADCSESGHAGLHSTTGLDCKGKAWRQSLQDISALVRQLLRVGILGRCRMTAACHEQVARRGDWNFTQALSISNCRLSAGHLGHS